MLSSLSGPRSEVNLKTQKPPAHRHLVPPLRSPHSLRCDDKHHFSSLILCDCLFFPSRNHCIFLPPTTQTQGNQPRSSHQKHIIEMSTYRLWECIHFAKGKQLQNTHWEAPSWCISVAVLVICQCLLQVSACATSQTWKCNTVIFFFFWTSPPAISVGAVIIKPSV